MWLYDYVWDWYVPIDLHIRNRYGRYRDEVLDPSQRNYEQLVL
jgi:hypothetical protein